MAAALKMTLEEARTALESLHAATQAAEPNALAPTDWVKSFHEAGRVIAVREVQHRYRVDGIVGVTIGHLSRRVTALLHDFDGLVEDNPRVSRKAR